MYPLHNPIIIAPEKLVLSDKEAFPWTDFN